jgi:hypothetical protein
MKNAGIVGVLRYLAPHDAPDAGKILTVAEKDALLADGFDIALNWEWYSGRCLDGFNAGVEDGRLAVAEAKALGYPAGKEIYFSHDTGVFNQSVIDYFRGVNASLGSEYQTGGYGGVNAIQQLHAAGVITKGWQTTAWSGGQKDPWAVIYQDGTQLFNGGADEDIISSTDIGSWLDGPGGLSVSDVQTLLDAISKLGATEVYGDPTHLNSLKDIRDHVLANSAELNDLKAVLADVDLRVAAVQAAVATIAAGPAGAKAVVAELRDTLVRGES